MHEIKIHIDQPAEIRLIIERDTTPNIDLLLYEDEEQTQPLDVADFVFAAYFKSSISVSNDDAAMSFADSDIIKKPDGIQNMIRISITQDQANDQQQLLQKGIWLLYWTDGNDHRQRLIKGEFEARS